MKKKLLIIILLGLISISLTGCLSMFFPEPNNPPVITSDPLETATLGIAYIYPVDATDLDGDTLTYSLLGNPPDGMTINSITGVISWTPTAVGSFEVTVEVSDGKSSDTQSFSVTVSEPPNRAPVITSVPVTSVILGETYTYTVEANDPEGDDLTYYLTDSPPDMTIDDNSGVINWTPTATGSFDVTVQVSDGELVATQSFTIVVSTDNHAPVTTPIPNATVTAGETFTYTVEATDPDGDDLSYSLLGTPPAGMTIDENSGVISWIPTATGNFEVTVEVSDGELSDTQNFTIEVIAPHRVVMWELFEGPACSRCKAIHSDIVRLRQEYNLDELVILEEYGWDTSGYTGWGIKDVRDRYYEYLNYLGIDGHFPDAYFNGINQTVHYNASDYNNYKSAIEAELAKPTKIAISASYNVTGKVVNISGNIVNISSGTLNNVVIEAMIYENSVYSEYRGYNVDHVVRDIITYEESGETISSFAPGGSHEFSLTSSSLTNVKNMSNIHVVVYVQALNSPTMEILQALYVE